MKPDLLNLIAQYWNLAYAEGKEGRTHDTEAGDAQRVWHEIKDAIAALEAAKLEAKPVGVPAGCSECGTPNICCDHRVEPDVTPAVELPVVAQPVVRQLDNGQWILDAPTDGGRCLTNCASEEEAYELASFWQRGSRYAQAAIAAQGAKP